VVAERVFRRMSRRRNPPFQVNKSAGYTSLTRPTRYSLNLSGNNLLIMLLCD
jgi:hypothetical protein